MTAPDYNDGGARQNLAEALEALCARFDRTVKKWEMEDRAELADLLAKSCSEQIAGVRNSQGDLKRAFDPDTWIWLPRDFGSAEDEFNNGMICISPAIHGTDTLFLIVRTSTKHGWCVGGWLTGSEEAIHEEFTDLKRLLASVHETRDEMKLNRLRSMI